MLLLILCASVGVLVGLFIGAIIGPKVHKFAKIAQDDLCRGEAAPPRVRPLQVVSPKPPPPRSVAPLISEDEFWLPSEKKPKRKGKRKRK